LLLSAIGGEAYTGGGAIVRRPEGRGRACAAYPLVAKDRARSGRLRRFKAGPPQKLP